MAEREAEELCCTLMDSSCGGRLPAAAFGGRSCSSGCCCWCGPSGCLDLTAM